MNKEPDSSNDGSESTNGVSRTNGTKAAGSQRDGEMSPAYGERQVKLLVGRVASAIGVIVAVFGVISVFLASSAAAADISGGAVALGLGLVGYSLGARRIGLAAMILGGLAVFVSLAATQGIIPGAPEGKQNLFQGPPRNPKP